MFPVFLLYHAADFIVEETRQASLLRAPALGRPLLLQTPLVSLAYSPDVPNPQRAVVGSGVEQFVVDLEQQGHFNTKLYSSALAQLNCQKSEQTQLQPNAYGLTAHRKGRYKLS